ncbi:MAG: CPBP family intramembrane metalloprotease [Ardenticatenaceae bacterium]|nr:CPBP family intramembrane metalloprotease [Ardenticatenaceae bacterium]
MMETRFEPQVNATDLHNENKRENTAVRLCKAHTLAAYFGLAVVFTWLILSPGVAATLGLLRFTFEGTLLTIVSGVGPLLAALIVTQAIEGTSGVRKIIGNIFAWRTNAKWWAAALLLMAGLFAISATISWFIWGTVPNASDGIYLNGGNLMIVSLLLLFGAFGEESGWRGFALPRLHARHTPLKATLILTLLWWLWHLPTYWTLPLAMNAMEQYGFAVAFGIQFIVLLALSLLCTWIYNGSGGVILLPVLLHASWNFWSGAFGQDVALFLLPLLLLTAVGIGLATKGKLGFKNASLSGG